MFELVKQPEVLKRRKRAMPEAVGIFRTTRESQRAVSLWSVVDWLEAKRKAVGSVGLIAWTIEALKTELISELEAQGIEKPKGE